MHVFSDFYLIDDDDLNETDCQFTLPMYGFLLRNLTPNEGSTSEGHH